MFSQTLFPPQILQLSFYDLSLCTLFTVRDFLISSVFLCCSPSSDLLESLQVPNAVLISVPNLLEWDFHIILPTKNLPTENFLVQPVWVSLSQLSPQQLFGDFSYQIFLNQPATSSWCIHEALAASLGIPLSVTPFATLVQLLHSLLWSEDADCHVVFAGSGAENKEKKKKSKSLHG